MLFGGGQQRINLFENSLNSISKKINIGGESSYVNKWNNIPIKTSFEKLSLNIEERNKQLKEPDNINTENQTQDIEKIFKEVVSEEETINLKKDFEGNVEASQKRLKNKGVKFDEAVKVVKSSSAENKHSLSKEQRTVLRDYFREFNSLEEKKHKLERQLEGVKSKSIVGSKSTPPSFSGIVTDLDKIGWSNEQITRKKETTRRARSLDEEEGFGWGSWALENPFRHFFDSEEEWKEMLDSAQKAKEKLDAYLKQQRVKGLFAMVLGAEAMNRLAYPLLPSLKKELENSNNGLEVKIAEKLLKIMKQI